MKILISQATIINEYSPMNNQKCDVLIDGDKISAIGNLKNEKADLRIDADGKYLCSGFTDLHVNFCEPGHEIKEDLISGTNAAAAGGFTQVLLMPSTQPVIQSKAQVEFVKSKTANQLTTVHCAGAMSVNCEAKDLSEMYDMHTAGVNIFTDDKKSSHDSGLLLRAMEYCKSFNGKIFCYASDKSIAGNAQVNESAVTMQSGLKGVPAIAEEIQIARNLQLAEYSNAHIHFSTISTAGSVALIREAKKKKIKVTADVAAHQLLLTDELVQTFDSNYKVKPPLRSSKDIDALIEGINDGTIDAICSDHSPQNAELKQVEFDLADDGIIGLQTAFCVASKATTGKITFQKLIESFTTKPSNIIGKPINKIAVDEKADLVLIDMNHPYTFTEEMILSKSKNSPFIGEKFTARIIGVFANGKHHINS